MWFPIVLFFIWFVLDYVIAAIAFPIAVVIVIFFMIPPGSWIYRFYRRRKELFWFKMFSSGSFFSRQNTAEAYRRFGRSRSCLTFDSDTIPDMEWALGRHKEMTGVDYTNEIPYDRR